MDTDFDIGPVVNRLGDGKHVPSVYFASLGATPFVIGLFVAYGTGVTVLALLLGGYIADT